MTWKSPNQDSRQKTKLKKKKKKKHESNIRDLWDNIKQANLHIIGIPEGEGKEEGIENILKKLHLKTFQI